MASSSRTVTRSRSGSRRRSAPESGVTAKRASAPTEVLIEGDTCWQLAHAKRAAALIDAASYFEALRASLLAAEHTILICGWELHSKTRLEGPARPRDNAPRELGKFLRFLLKRKPGLEIRILLWNHPMFYAVHRELFPRWLFWRHESNRVEVLLDSHLPAGASHHEKLVVVDDTVAYCGGIDLTVRRWDIAAHHPAEPRRRYPRSKPYIPQHDVQLVVEGEAAAALGERIRGRWEHAGGKPLRARKARRSVWPKHVKPDFTDLPVGIIRTVAALEERDEDIREVERCTVAAFARAQRFVYIENQYITSKSACEALVARMRENPSLEAVVVTSCDPGGWLEAETMGVGRQRFMAAFAEPAIARRIQFVAPLAHADGDLGAAAAIAPDGVLKIHVHAKVLVVDDAFLRIGSSNLNNRSMGFDTECDLGIEAADDAQRRAIASVRNRLIAEHWGSDEESVAAALDSDAPVAQALESLPRVPVFSTGRHARHPRLTPWRRAARAPAQRNVTPVKREEVVANDLVLQLGDPESVVSAEELIAQATGLKSPHRILKWGAALLGAALLLGLIASAATRLDLGSGDLVGRIVAGIESLAGSPWRVPLVLVAFVAASVVAVPILALIGATVVALGPVLGFACSAAGTMLAASATFGIGRLIGREPLRRRFGNKLDALEKRIAKSGVIAIALIRKVPVAPFTFVNMGLGALGIRYRDFMFGTALGMLPGIAAFSFVSDRAIDAWREPTLENIAWIAGAIAVWVGIVLGIQHWLNRRAGK
jgi:phospholipase D1/2